MFDVMRTEKFRKPPVRFEMAVVAAATDPEQAQLFVRRVGIGDETLVRARKFRRLAHAGTEAADVTEQLEMIQPDAQRLAAAHRQPDDRALPAVAAGAIVRFDE